METNRTENTLNDLIANATADTERLFAIFYATSRMVLRRCIECGTIFTCGELDLSLRCPLCDDRHYDRVTNHTGCLPLYE